MPGMPRKPTGDPVQMNARLWDNPYIKGLVWFVGVVIAVGSTTLSAAAWVESRYAKTEEVQAVRTDVVAQAKQVDVSTKQLEVKIEYQADQNRKRTLEDALFKFDLTPEKQKTQTDRALAAKYQQEIREMNARWNQRGMPLK